MVVFAQTVVFNYSVILCFILIKKTKTFSINLRFTFCISYSKKVFPILLILLMTIYYRIDSVMLERILDDQSVRAGIYAQAYRLGFLAV